MAMITTEAGSRTCVALLVAAIACHPGGASTRGSETTVPSAGKVDHVVQATPENLS